MRFSVSHCTKYLLLLLSLSPLATIANEFKIYRARYQGNPNDHFVTSQSVCNASNPSCHDYNAEKISCNECACGKDNETFGYYNGAWRCFGAREFRQNTGCFVGDIHAPSHLQVVKTSDNLKLNLSLHAECTYSFNQNTYYRTCDGKWSAASSIGTTRYDFFVRTTSGNPDKHEYWIVVEDKAEANFEGRIMKIEFECKQPGVKPWIECFVFKEKYVSKPIVCPILTATPIPSIKSETSTRQNSTFSPVPNAPSSTTSSSSSTQEHATEPTTSDIGSSMTTNGTSFVNKDSEGTGISKNLIYGVSAAGVALVVALVITICIICCRKRQRRDISKYTAALYDSTQGQCSAGIYAETSIRLPSASKSFTLTSHSHPSYERGRDFSIKLADSQKQTATPSSPPRLAFTNESFEDDITTVTSKVQEIHPRSPVKQRGNMLVKYENVTILSDPRPESVPDAERFYDNPGADAPEYQVLEHPTEEAQSYGELYHPRLKDHNLEHAQSSGDFTSDVNHCVIDNDVIDEPVYANSPAIASNNSQENKFSFDVSDDNFVDQESINYEKKENDNDVYANSEALRSSYSDIQSAHNDAYEDDDDASHSNEPIYDNHSIMNNTSGSGGSPLLTNQSHQAIYQDLKSTQAQESDYQALTPVTDRKANQIKPKPKPRQRNKRQ